MVGAHPSSAGPLLVFGSFPPVAGPVTAATVEAVRGARRDGTEVETASARPSGAAMYGRVSGVGAGRRLERLRRLSGAPSVLLALDRGVPGGAVPGPVGTAAGFVAAWSLASSLRRFDRASLLVAADPGLPGAALRPLWAAANEVVVVSGCEPLADRLGVPVAMRRVVPAPPPLAGLVSAGLTATGPAEVTALAMPRYALGVAGRRILGRRFPWVHHQVLRSQDRLRTALRRSSAVLGRR